MKDFKYFSEGENEKKHQYYDGHDENLSEDHKQMLVKYERKYYRTQRK